MAVSVNRAGKRRFAHRPISCWWRLLVVLALPYVMTPFYRVGHPASTLMAWRWLTGAPMHAGMD